nr:MAG TPA: hypothetical protein [Caudoviricetes sp.]DAW10169.1 MAG TPA: hypothetical protein [Caudoviricetes sp.]DAY35033.1 MAG TPA: hypothetical protein [Caudoviricetes sp.]
MGDWFGNSIPMEYYMNDTRESPLCFLLNN